jgi:hypothetical protein
METAILSTWKPLDGLGQLTIYRQVAEGSANVSVLAWCAHELVAMSREQNAVDAYVSFRTRLKYHRPRSSNGSDGGAFPYSLGINAVSDSELAFWLVTQRKTEITPLPISYTTELLPASICLQSTNAIHLPPRAQ